MARNRLKRRLRELSRTRLVPSDIAADVVIRIRPDAYRARFESLATDVERIVVQLYQWRAGKPEPLAATLENGVDLPTGDT